MKTRQLYKAKEVFDDIFSMYVYREYKNHAIQGHWFTDDGLFITLNPFVGKADFISFESLDIWAEEHYADTAKLDD